MPAPPSGAGRPGRTAGPTVANLSFSQLEGLWISAGGPKVLAPVAAAIALAESSGNPNAINPTDNNGTQTSWGLWQISNGTHAEVSPNWADPLTNARLAVAKWRGAGNSFSPWGTYDSGAYRRYLPSSYVAPTGTPPGTVQTATLAGFNPGDILDPFQAVVDIAQSLGQAIAKPADIATSMTRLSKDFNSFVTLANVMVKDFEWLFVPSHWIRVMSFFGGVAFAVPGVQALIKVGDGRSGDVTLALGILLLIIAGILLFIAFHNLPTDIRDLQGLLGYISSGLQPAQAQGAQ